MGAAATAVASGGEQHGEGHEVPHHARLIGRAARESSAGGTGLRDVLTERPLVHCREQIAQFELCNTRKRSASSVGQTTTTTSSSAVELRPLIASSAGLSDATPTELLSAASRTALSNRLAALLAGRTPPEFSLQNLENWADTEWASIRANMNFNAIAVWIVEGPWVGTVTVGREGWLQQLTRLLWQASAALAASSCSTFTDGLIAIRPCSRPVFLPAALRGVDPRWTTIDALVVTAVWRRDWEILLRPVKSDLWVLGADEQQPGTYTTRQLAVWLAPALLRRAAATNSDPLDNNNNSELDGEGALLLSTAPYAELLYRSNANPVAPTPGLTTPGPSSRELRFSVVSQLLRRSLREERDQSPGWSETALAALQVALAEDHALADELLKAVWDVFLRAAAAALAVGPVLAAQRRALPSPWRFWHAAALVRRLSAGGREPALCAGAMAVAALSATAVFAALCRSDGAAGQAWTEMRDVAASLPAAGGTELPTDPATVDPQHKRAWRDLARSYWRDVANDELLGLDLRASAAGHLLALGREDLDETIANLQSAAAESAASLDKALSSVACQLKLSEYSSFTYLVEFRLGEEFAKRLFHQPNARVELWRDLNAGERRAEPPAYESLWSALKGGFAGGGRTLCVPRVEFLNLLELTEWNYDEGDDAGPTRGPSPEESVGLAAADGIQPLEIETADSHGTYVSVTVDEQSSEAVTSTDLVGLLRWYLKFCLTDGDSANGFTWETAPMVARVDGEWRATLTATCPWEDGERLERALEFAVAHAPSRNVLTHIAVSRPGLRTAVFRVWSSAAAAACGVSLGHIFAGCFVAD